MSFSAPSQPGQENPTEERRGSITLDEWTAKVKRFMTHLDEHVRSEKDKLKATSAKVKEADEKIRRAMVGIPHKGPMGRRASAEHPASESLHEQELLRSRRSSHDTGSRRSSVENAQKLDSF